MHDDLSVYVRKIQAFENTMYYSQWSKTEFLGNIGFMACNFWVCIAMQQEGNWNRPWKQAAVSRIFHPGHSLLLTFFEREWLKHTGKAGYGFEYFCSAMQSLCT